MALFIYLSIYAFVFAPMVIPPVCNAVRTVVELLRIKAPSGAQRSPRFAV
ncbi:hypothetical protein [Antrihabitans stalactiti]|nr:hypothetical protein [Antrihabitans stalactiti]